MSDELKERPIAFDTERPSQSEIDAAVAEITARLKAADAKDARIKELEAENQRLRDEIQSAIYAMSCPVSASGSGALAILRKALLGGGE